MSQINQEIYNRNYSDENMRIAPKTSYDKRMFDLRFSLIEKYGKNKDVVDLCCGTGSYLIPKLDLFKSIVGLDFSSNMLSILRKKFKDDLPPKLTLLENDAENISLPDNSVDFLFSYTSLYHLEHLDRCLQGVSRILRPDGHAVLEIGNSVSLNKIVADIQHKERGWAKIYCTPLRQTIIDIQRANLKILKIHSFQLLPMYGAPKRLWFLLPLLSPHWKKILGIKCGRKVLDEWISSAWPFRHFAFRHVFELKK